MDNNINNGQEEKEEKLNNEESLNNSNNLQLEEEIEKLKKEKEEILNSFKRERADFLNYKKEEVDRISRNTKYFLEKVILKILPALDSFNVAEKNISEDLKKEDLVLGFMGIKDLLDNFLKSFEIEEIDSLGQEFNPNFHEAIEMVEVKDKDSGIIIEEVQKGYMFKDKRVIRPSKVKVNK